MSGVLGLMVGLPSTLVSISNQSGDHTTVDPADATAGYRLLSTGSAEVTLAGVYTAITGEWLRAGAASSYEARATLQSGTTPSGTLNSWLGLGTNRTWDLTTTVAGLITCDILIEIRLASSGVVQDSATITLTAERSP